MSTSAPQNISLNIDGKNIEIKNTFKLNSELNKVLLDANEFAKFRENPKDFAKRFELDIDAEISDKLKEKLNGINSVKEIHEKIFINDIQNKATTVWAIAQGSYSLASSKVAVAF